MVGVLLPVSHPIRGVDSTVTLEMELSGSVVGLSELLTSVVASGAVVVGLVPPVGSSRVVVVEPVTSVGLSRVVVVVIESVTPAGPSGVVMVVVVDEAVTPVEPSGVVVMEEVHASAWRDDCSSSKSGKTMSLVGDRDTEGVKTNIG